MEDWIKRFIRGEDRGQATLIPARLEDYVGEDNPVRVIDAFIDELDLSAPDFSGVVPEATGRPGYHPAALLKIYLYGYLNRIRSSRRLERETQHNIELMWLTGRLMSDFKTIADFRRDNGPAIRAASTHFIVLCRQFNLFTGITEKIEGLRRQMKSLKEMERQVEAAPDKQVALSDPDAGSMATSGKGTGTGTVGYNVQIAVDAEHHLIVAHEVTNVGSDRARLTFIGK